MRLKIVQTGDPVLRLEAAPVQPRRLRDAGMKRLIADVCETMRDAPGVGLAAPQVGISLRLAVIEDREEYHRDLSPARLAALERAPVPFQVLVNPVLSPVLSNEPGETVTWHEGCLSLGGFVAAVPRARRVRVDYLDEHGTPRVIEAAGWYARILQHEIDHLHGLLYIDRMRSETFSSVDNWKRFAGVALPGGDTLKHARRNSAAARRVVPRP